MLPSQSVALQCSHPRPNLPFRPIPAATGGARHGPVGIVAGGFLMYGRVGAAPALSSRALSLHRVSSSLLSSNTLFPVAIARLIRSHSTVLQSAPRLTLPCAAMTLTPPLAHPRPLGMGRGAHHRSAPSAHLRCRSGECL